MAYAHHVRPLVAARRRTSPAAAVLKARKPTDAQLRSKRLTKSGVKFLLRHCLPRGRAAVEREIQGNAVLARNVQRLFAGDVAACIAELGGGGEESVESDLVGLGRTGRKRAVVG
jgi:hypothetical protein